MTIFLTIGAWQWRIEQYSDGIKSQCIFIEDCATRQPLRSRIWSNTTCQGREIKGIASLDVLKCIRNFHYFGKLQMMSTETAPRKVRFMRNGLQSIAKDTKMPSKQTSDKNRNKDRTRKFSYVFSTTNLAKIMYIFCTVCGKQEFP